MVTRSTRSARSPGARARWAPLFMVWTLIACGAGSAACAAVLGFERLSEDGASSEGGSPETAPPTEAGADSAMPETGPTCTALGVPDRPTVFDAGADARDPIHMAVRILDYGIDTAAAAPGFNLDHACSPSVATSTCVTKIDEATFGKYGKDKNDQGLDNSGYGLLGYLAYLGPAFAPTSINDRLHAGEYGAVVRLANWNGTDEDDDVIVEIFPAIGLWDHPDGGPMTPGATPTFTSDDQWIRDRRFQNIVDASRIKSANAWVTGGRLVASFQKVTLPVSVPDDKKPLDVILQEAYLSGPLVADGTSFRIKDAVLGGRWRTADMLGQVRTIWIKNTVGLNNVVLCEPNLKFDVYGAVKKEVCDGRDIRSSSVDDGKNLPCDSFSAGIRLDTYAVDVPGTFGDLPAASPPVATRCQIDGSIPEGDDCAPASQ
jgi:hypothetical protein